MLTCLALMVSTSLLGATALEAVPVTDADAPTGMIEIRGVGAGEFDAALWQGGMLHLLPDERHPFLEPRPGRFRNIYAPSIVKLPEGWRIFYGGFDGIETGNDFIYQVDTPDFMSFGERHTVISHGDFIHVCNVNAFRNPDGSFEMMCTVYPDPGGNNKPGYFSSPDGETWNDSPMPYHATLDDLVTIEGYEDYEGADINGMNVLLREGDKRRIYHNDFHNMGTVFRATGTDGQHFEFEQGVLETPYFVNDVKVFQDEGQDWYLMGLHRNTQGLWYSLSNDGLEFEPTQELLTPLGDEDNYIVAIGWVREGNQILGVLYGAGAVPVLNENRIFARWLQHRVVFEAEDGTRYEAESSYGPERQRFALPAEGPVSGVFHVYAEDGETPVGEPIPATLTPGEVWEIRSRLEIPTSWGCIPARPTEDG